MLRIRSHTATVVIRYDKDDYQINYVDSTNLKFNPDDLRKPGRRGQVIPGPRIHRNYNIWVQELASAVSSYLQHPPKASRPSPSIESSEPVMIADELEKLDSLRERGILTDAEFARQKDKLLR
jgi:hypothetical protein